MKGLPRPRPRHYLRSLAFLCLLGLRVMSFNSVEAQAENITTAPQLLALKEGELSTFANAVEANARNCDAPNGCSSSTCSRLSCYKYGTPGDRSYSCLEVSDNILCNASGSAPVCMQRNFDFTKGYIRRVDPVDIHVARTVCTHRSLDDHFKNSTMNDPSHFFRVFFGAVDGTMRIYPGADEPCDNIYDPRVRPWYLESTYIPKVVTVLIDSGLNMRGTISGTDDETYISKAITTALRVLDTLKEDADYVTFACFDGDGIKQLGATMIYNRTRMYQSFNDSLTAVVASASKGDPNSTHTNNAINNATSQLVQLTSSNSIPANYLKVVIVLIGGQQYDNIADLNVTSSPIMNLFVYSFRKPLLPQCNIAIRASLEEIPDDRLSNPLYALQSYYSFLAKLHISFMKNQTDYGPQYPDYSGVDDHTVTLSKAAFGPTGELLGVLGIDFYEKKVEEQFPTIQFASIVEEAGKHDPGRIFDTAVDLVTNVCFNHNDTCPGLASDNWQGFLCGVAKSTDINIGCCGSCKGSISAVNKKKTPLGPVLGGAIAGFVALIFVIWLIWFCCRKHRKAGRRDKDVKPVYPPFTGPPEGQEDVSESGSAMRVG